MKKLLTFLFILCLFSLSAQCPKGTIVISEIYFDSHYGENINSEFHHFGEYIELYNSSDQAINLNGWLIKDNHTEFRITTSQANPNTTIQPGGFKIIIFGGFYAYRHIVEGGSGTIDTGASSGIGNRNKFIELFPQADSHDDDILVQQTMVLYNSSERISLYNPNNRLVHEISYGNGSVHATALQYLGIESFTKVLNVLDNGDGGIFNGAIGTVPLLDQNGDPILDSNGNAIMTINTNYLKSICLEGQENYYFGGDTTIINGFASPFSIPVNVPLEPVNSAIFDPPSDENWTHQVTYNLEGDVVGDSRTYFDALAKPVNHLNKDVRTGEIWGTQTSYDAFGRVDKSSFPALTCLNFEKANFLTDPFFYQNNLAWYYSNNNSLEPYQATATHPFSQVVYDNLNPGNIISTIGGNMVNGEWKTGFSYTMPAAQELYYLYGTNYFNGATSTAGEDVITEFYKTVSIDANGVENVVFTDGEGKTLATARSGGTISYPVISLIGPQGYVDVHIPVGIPSAEIVLLGNAADYTIYNLRTGALVTGGLSAGNVYRISAPITSAVPNFVACITPSGGVQAKDVSNSKGIRYKVNYYDYALNVHNATGQIIKSIQPKGIPSTIFSSVQASPAYLSSDQFASISTYDLKGRLASVKTADQGTTKFLYRKDGKLRYSQTTLQANQSTPQVSYTQYDSFGRAIEGGVIQTATTWQNLDPDATALVGGTKVGETFVSIYDYPTNYLPGQQLPPVYATILSQAGLSASAYVQHNLSGHVAITFTYSPASTSISAATWYSYDIYGRMEWIVEYINGLPAKTIHYLYDVNGNLSKTIYQKNNSAEMFVHRYTYNTGGSLAKVETSTNNITFTNNLQYSYYLTGELKRRSYAGGIQGTDYVYTLGGQLKSINHPSLEQAKDPGHDSNDLFGLTLDYYSGDYIRSGTDITSSASVTNLNQDSYNGTIKATRFANRTLDGPSVQQKAYLFKYNRNNWLTDANFGTVSGNIVTPLSKYREGSITYDSNGNILTLRRSNENGLEYDNLALSYNSGKNQLNRVNDLALATPSISYDIEPQSANNYEYNSIGQLTKNISEDLYYTYNGAGLVTEIKKGSNPLVRIYYNDRGGRVRKETFSTASPYNLIATDFYVTDPSGRVVAIYNKALSGPVTLKEHPIYADGRIGLFSRNGNITNYELTDHLGNIRAVFKKVSSSAVMDVYSDYYPFGEKLPQRNSAANYRYGFQGQEFDPESGMEAFKLRLWDGRIGRWLSPDPYGQYASPYVGMGNNPISMIDPDGGFAGSGDGYCCEWFTNLWNKITGGDESTGITGSQDDVIVLDEVVITKYANKMLWTVGGFLNAWGSDNLMGAGKYMPKNLGEYEFNYRVGSFVGHLASMYTGFEEIVIGGGGGTVLAPASGGTSAVVGYAIAGHGITVVGNGLINSLAEAQGLVDYMSESNHDSSGSSGTSDTDGIKPDDISISDAQFGKKFGKHKEDYPGITQKEYKAKIYDVFNNKNTKWEKGANGELYGTLGKDLLRVKQDGTFVSLYPGGK